MTGFAIIAALISFYVSDMLYRSVVARAKPLFPSNLQDERAASFSLGAYTLAADVSSRTSAQISFVDRLWRARRLLRCACCLQHRSFALGGVFCLPAVLRGLAWRVGLVETSGAPVNDSPQRNKPHADRRRGDRDPQSRQACRNARLARALRHQRAVGRPSSISPSRKKPARRSPRTRASRRRPQRRRPGKPPSPMIPVWSSMRSAASRAFTRRAGPGRTRISASP